MKRARKALELPDGLPPHEHTMEGMPAHTYAILAAGWLIWLTPFFLVKRNSAKPEKRDRRARWGIVLEGLAYWLVWQSKFWARTPENWRVALSIFFFVSAGLLSWTAARTLGRQWRFDAGLNQDHELVQSGAYRVVRHPIYTSMLCLLLGTGFMITPLPMLVLSTLLFMIGAEIRVRIEDAAHQSRLDGLDHVKTRNHHRLHRPLERKDIAHRLSNLRHRASQIVVVQHQLFSLTQHSSHGAELLSQLIDFICVLIDPLKPAIGFFNLPLNL